MARRRIVICVPELFRETGGIQNFSRSLIAACDEICGQPVTVVSRNDRRQDLPAEFSDDRTVHCVGALPNQLRPFGLMAASARYRHDNVLMTHPRFSPWFRLLQAGSNGQYAVVAHGIEVWGAWSRPLASGMAGAAKVLAVSEFTRASIYSHLNGECPPTEVFPNTVDADRFHPGPPAAEVRRQFDVPPTARVMLTVSRVSKSEDRKGYRQVLKLLPSLVREFPDLVWVLAGKGNDLEDVRQEAAKLGVAGNCRFPGFVSDDDLPSLYRASDCFVLPSRKEGFGIVFLEAIATGLPAIGGNLDGSVDALAHGRLGVLINPDDSAELQEAIRSVLTGRIPEHLKNRDSLHRECVSRFGFASFRDRLQHELAGLGWLE
jgi:glycosyltransferase involved in cell wall biosynthesis